MKNMTHNAAPLEAGPSGLALPTTAFSRAADRVITWFGEFASALWLILVLVIVIQVIARYAFGAGSIAMEELLWHLYAIGFMLGISFTEVKERNVRIDVVAERFQQRTRQWIELFGLAGLLVFCGVVIWYAIPFFWSSYQLNEVSAAAGGLPYRWVIKSFLVTAFVLLALAAISRLTRVWAALFTPHNA
jgi:TRAP-type mannitol/chloroaromatic compound transport system permease small subunit